MYFLKETVFNMQIELWIFLAEMFRSLEHVDPGRVIRLNGACILALS